MRLAVKKKRILKSPEDRRQEILDAAMRAFSERGVSKATVADIAEAAGVAKGTVYLYFGSKEQLLGALRDRFVDEVLAHVSDLLQRIGQDDLWALVDKSVEGMIHFMLDRKELMLVFMEEGLSSDTARVFPNLGTRVDAMFATAIQAGIETGVFHASDPEMMAGFFHHAIEGVLLHAMCYGDPVNADRLVDAAKELVHKALAQ